MDSLSKEKRSWIMSRVKSKNTKPELFVRKFLHSQGFRYRLHVKNLPGTPDIVLTRLKTVIFVHGCFWHGHPSCKKAKLPKTDVDKWSNKIKRNAIKDTNNVRSLQKAGWNVIIVWQCELNLKRLIEIKDLLTQGMG